MKRLAGAFLVVCVTVGLCTALPAQAATAPDAVTGSASAITTSSAVISGTVNPQGTATTYSVEYGTSTSYGQRTSSASAGSGSSASNVQVTLTGLSPSTTYHYRLQASSTAGTTNGADATFTTSAAPPSATTGSASSLTTTSATVAASVNPNGQATTYVFQYGTTTGYGTQTSSASAGSGTGATTVRATIRGLASNTTYHYRVVATSAAGSAQGADATFTTAAQPPTLSNIHPTFVNSRSASLQATVYTHGKATTYSVQYGTSSAYGAQTTAVTTGTATTTVHVSLSGLTPATVYHYRFVATSAEGTSASADAAFETSAGAVPAGAAVPVVSQAAAVAITPHSVQLNGAINPVGTTTTWYFDFGLTANYGLRTASRSLPGLGLRAINAQLQGLQPGTTYHFRLVASTANGLYVGPDATFTTKTPPRVRPGALVVVPTARRTHHKLVLTIGGSIQLPAGVSAGSGCNGGVSVTVRRGAVALGRAQVRVHPDCTYTAHIGIAKRRLRHGSHGVRLTIVASFWGNAALSSTRGSAHYTFR